MADDKSVKDLSKCPICKSLVPNTFNECQQCGLIFSNSLFNQINLQNYYQTLRYENWSKAAELINQVHNFKKKNINRPPRMPWTQKETSKLFNINEAIVSEGIKLAEAFKYFPDLREYKNRNQALSHLSLISNSPLSPLFKTFDTEYELHNYFEKNWEQTFYAEEWELIDSHYNAGEIGELDLLAKNKKNESWLIIELKIGRTSDHTVGQLLRYMGWYNSEKLKNNGVVIGHIICGSNTDDKLFFATAAAENIDLVFYYKTNGSVKFLKGRQIQNFRQFAKLSEDEFIKSISDI